MRPQKDINATIHQHAIEAVRRRLLESRERLLFRQSDIPRIVSAVSRRRSCCTVPKHTAPIRPHPTASSQAGPRGILIVDYEAYAH